MDAIILFLFLIGGFIFLVIIAGVIYAFVEGSECLLSPFSCLFGNRDVGTACARDSVCKSKKCIGGRCTDKNGKLPPGSKCTVGEHLCTAGYHCGEAGGGKIACTPNNPNGFAPGDSCGVDAQCASGICLIPPNRCAASDGKLPCGSRCGDAVSTCEDTCIGGTTHFDWNILVYVCC